MAISKIVYKSSPSATPVTWMDATPATAAAADITSPKTAMLADGVVTTGTGTGGGMSVTVETLANGGQHYIVSGNAITADDIAFKRAPVGAVTLTTSGALGNYALYGCSLITSISGQNITGSGNNSLGYCSNMTSADFPNMTVIGSGCFQGCTKLKTINLPRITALASDSFHGCNALENYDFSEFTNIPSGCFRECGMAGCSFDPVTVQTDAFRDTYKMEQTIFPNLTTINGSYTFAGSYSLDRQTQTDTIVLPLLTTMTSQYVFSYNGYLKKVDFGVLPSIPASTFNKSNGGVEILILRKTDSITTLSNINAFETTPFASDGTGGTLYVPQSLISIYQSASNWSTILSYANNSIVAIEGSQYENYYADGTAIS